MATCQMCGGKTRGLLTEICEACAALRKSDALVASTTPEPALVASHSEGSTAKLVGNVVIWLSLASSVVCILVFGRVSVPDGSYATKEVWSWLLVTAFVAAGANGVFFGYLLSKVGSVLLRLEQLRH
jgi:hypothetical protein